jgi:hypothetical protein
VENPVKKAAYFLPACCPAAHQDAVKGLDSDEGNDFDPALLGYDCGLGLDRDFGFHRGVFCPLAYHHPCQRLRQGVA